MSISSEITRISGNIADAYTAANGKGATMPVTQNSDNLATTISTIQTGTTPTGTIQITTNGTHDVTNYASADVQVPTTAPAHYIEFNVDGNGKAQYSSQIADFTGITDISDYLFAQQYYDNRAISGTVDMSDLTTVSGQYACYSMFSTCTGITSVNLSSLTTVSGYYACGNMFQNCTRITSVDLSSLTTVIESYACYYMFQSCVGITSVDLSSLTTINAANACSYMFRDCTGITSVDLSSLTTISGGNACSYMFFGCTGITSVDLSGLTTISGNNACRYMFQICTSLATVYIGGTTTIDFGTNTNQFTSMFQGCTQNIDVYAPSANKTQIEAFSGYPNFGGTGTVTWHWRS